MKEVLITDKNLNILSTKGFEYNSMKPTQSLVQKWLRETYGINIRIDFKPNIKKWDHIPYPTNLDGRGYIKYASEYKRVHRERRYDTYELALEDGITEALNMIN